MADFSGYIAADELCDGPFCMLSIVDNRTFKRLAYRVLDHHPNQDDIADFFRGFRATLDQRGLTPSGITTDGSALYPVAIAEVFQDVSLQVCEFHVLAELTKAVLGAVAKVREQLAAKKPKLERGRPGTKQARRAARRKKRLEQKIADLFEHRYLSVQHHLGRSERKTLTQTTRGLPQLRTPRSIMGQVYRLFDRRCRTGTALEKPAALRRRVRRFRAVGRTLQKVFSPNLEKALTSLDDRLLGATSNAVERGNRRYRKMQKTAYRVRTQAHIEGRMALDMLRESRASGRFKATEILHHARAA